MWAMSDSTAAQSLISGEKYLPVKMLNEFDCKEIKKGPASTLTPCLYGALGKNRTCDLPLRRGPLYPLSYQGFLHFTLNLSKEKI